MGPSRHQHPGSGRLGPLQKPPPPNTSQQPVPASSLKAVCMSPRGSEAYSVFCSLTLPSCGSSIQRYAVIPLSTNSGLIGWVPHCDTLHALIRDYREKKKILLNI